MLRACAISFPKKWDECLTLAEFSYNNSYQESIRMAPFEALYGKKCRTPLNWVKVRDRGYFGPDFIKEAREQVSVIQIHLKTAQSRQKTYVDKRRRLLQFEVGDQVYLKVSPMRGVHCFGVRGKLAPAMLDLIRFWPGVVLLPTISSSRIFCQQYIMSSMFPS